MYRLIDENEDFLVVDKQPEVSIHDEHHDDHLAAASTASKKGLIKQLRIDFNNKQIAPVHRLDKPTSGLLLCSKNPHAASVLSQVFQHRDVEKYYLAISMDKPLKKQGLVCGDMLRTRNGNWKLSKTTTKPAITQFFSYSLLNITAGKGRLFILKPHTGKTHQLRVVLKTIASPILGDTRYGKTIGEASSQNQRMHLHAYVLRFTYNNTQYSYTALPTGGKFTPELTSYISETVGSPWLLEWPKLPSKFL